MKRLILKILNKTAAFLGWKWLFFLAGIALMGGIESCETTTPMCYDPVVPEDSTQTSSRKENSDTNLIEADQIIDSVRTNER